MTKRFTHKRNRLGMQFICYDDKEELLGTFADADGVTHIVELLNELHEENQGLKSSNLEYEDALARLEEKIQRERTVSTKQHFKWSKEAEMKIKELSEENEQCKMMIATLRNIILENGIDIND